MLRDRRLLRAAGARWTVGALCYCAVVQAGAAPESHDGQLHTDYLQPETVALQGCMQHPSRLDPQEQEAADIGTTNGVFCIADLVAVEQWKSRDSGGVSRLSNPPDPRRSTQVLAASFEATDPNASKVEFSLSSQPVRAMKFDKVDAVRIWIKGNGSSAGLRVWLADRDGEVFTHQRPLRLNFSTWAQEHLSFAPEYVLSHGKRANGYPDPPIVLHRITVAGSAEAMRGEIRIDELSVVGVPLGGESPATGTTTDASLTGAEKSHTPIQLQLADRAKRSMPTNAGSVVRQDLVIKNNLENATAVRLEANVHRVLGETSTVAMTYELGAGVRRDISLPIDLASPGWYRMVVCAYLQDMEPSCVRNEYFAWQPAGNDIEDVPSTFPGAMLSADRFIRDLSTDLQVMKQAGVKVLRFPFRWEHIEKRQGIYSWRAYDIIFEQCRKADIIPQPMVVQTPDWARRAPFRKSAGKSATGQTPPEDMETFRRFMEDAAKRYAKYSPYWEIWNEPLSRTFWAGGTNEDYVALLKAGYSGIKAADSSALVLSAGAWAVDGRPAQFSRHLMKNGRDYFDGLSLHSHGGVHRLLSDLNDMEKLWNDARDRPPIWLNETGVAVDPRRTDGDLIKAAETVKKMVVARARGVDNFGWFIFKHLPNSYKSPYNNYSAVDEEGAPRPVLLAYNNANNMLRRSRLADAQVEDARYVAYEFKNEGKRILVAWSRDESVVARLNQFPAWVADGVDIYDMFGALRAADKEMQSSTIALTGNPVFLVGKYTGH